MKNKVFALLLVATCQLFLLCSCLNSVQLNESSIVQAIGIDYADGEFSLTLQIFNPAGSGSSTQIDASKNNCAIISTTGATIDEAIKKADTVQGKKIFTGHNRVIVLGEEFAKMGIDSMFSYFDRNTLTRQNVTLLVAEGLAKDILSVNIDQSILSAEVIEMMVDNSSENGYIVKMSYSSVSKNMYLYNGSAVIPMIAKVEEEESSEKSDSEGSSSGEEESSSDEISSLSKLELKNTAVFSDYAMKGYVDNEETKGLVFLSDKMESSNIVVDEDEYKATVNLYKNKTTVSPKYEDNILKFEFDIKAEGSADEIILPKDADVSEDLLLDMEERIEKQINKQCIYVLHRLLKEYKSDVLYLNERAYTLNPTLIEGMGDDFYENLDNIEFDCKVNFSIDRTGMEING